MTVRPVSCKMIRAVVLQEKRRLRKSEIGHIGSLVALAMDDVHMMGIAHLDLRPASIAFLPGGKIKIQNFGEAGFIYDKQHMSLERGTLE
jgi:serine/threonine protein kinase